MNPLKTEPSLTFGASVAAVMGLLVYYRVLTIEGAGVWTTFLLAVGAPLAQAVITRSQVFSSNTIREAGFDPQAVKDRAADASIPRCERGE
jgi:uncharacterized membrane protein YhiD involved in acid resistance